MPAYGFEFILILRPLSPPTSCPLSLINNWMITSWSSFSLLKSILFTHFRVFQQLLHLHIISRSLPSPLYQCMVFRTSGCDMRKCGPSELSVGDRVSTACWDATIWNPPPNPTSQSTYVGSKMTSLTFMQMKSWISMKNKQIYYHNLCVYQCRCTGLKSMSIYSHLSLTAWSVLWNNVAQLSV